MPQHKSMIYRVKVVRQEQTAYLPWKSTYLPWKSADLPICPEKVHICQKFDKFLIDNYDWLNSDSTENWSV